MPTRRMMAPLVTGLAIVAVWAVLAPTLGEQLLPGPGVVLERFWLELTVGGLLGHAAITLGVSALGCVLGVVIALPLGYLIAHVPVVSAAVGPYLAASQAIPAVALAPLLVVWVGYGTVPTALLCTLMVFFPITINTVLGFARLDADVIGAARVDGAGTLTLLVWIEFPLALPAILAGIRNGFVLSVTGAVVGEFVMGGQGLGELLAVYRDRGDTTGMLAVLGALVLAAVALFGAVRLLERRLQW